MQAVILAAGYGTRMGELTKKLPKSLVEVAGKTLLEHKFDALPEEIDEIILVVGYLGDMIRTKFGDSYEGRNITYVDCPNPVGGTMYALAQAEDVVKGKFLVSNGDDIHLKKDILKCLQHEWALAVIHLNDLHNASLVRLAMDGTIEEIVESNMHKGGAGLGGVGLYVLDSRIFDVPQVKLEGRAEYGLPQTMLSASRVLHIPVTPVEISLAIHLTTPDDIVDAEKILKKQM